MASLFRTVKHEDLSDFNKWKTQVRKETELRRDRDEKLLRLDSDTNASVEGDENESDHEDKKKKPKPVPKTNKGQDIFKASANLIVGEAAKEEEESNVDDRVFVCLGR